MEIAFQHGLRCSDGDALLEQLAEGGVGGAPKQPSERGLGQADRHRIDARGSPGVFMSG
jgi:hypothetical protein